MRPTALVLAVAVLGSLPLATASARVSLGSDLGFGIVFPEDSDNISVVQWPTSAAVLQPGLRVGFAGANPAHEFYLASGLLLLSSGGTSAHDFILTGNYQHNFVRARDGGSPYLTFGLGFVRESFELDNDELSATSFTFGGGVGVRFAVAQDHGTLRMEARLDHHTQGEDGLFTVIDEASSLGLRFGFDLWLD